MKVNTNTTETWVLGVLVVLLLVTSAFVTSGFRLDILNSSEDNSVRHLYNFGERFSLTGTIKSVNQTSPQHMPAHHVQLSIWADLAGFDFGILRAMSWYPLLIGIAFTFRLGRDLFNQKTALLATFVMAFSAYYIYFGHEIRMYSLVVAQAATLFWLYWRIVISPKRAGWYHFGFLFLISSYSIYTHSVMIFPLFAIGLYHLLFAPKNRVWVAVAVTEVLAGITFLYWLPNLIDGTRNIKDLTLTNQTAIEVLGSSIFAYSNGFWVAGLTLIALVIWKYTRKDRNFQYLMTLVIATLAGIIGLNFFVAYIPLERMRYTVVWLPVIALLWGIGLHILWQYSRWLLLAVLAVWLGFFVWFLQSDDLREYANILTQDLQTRIPINNLLDVLRHEYSSYESVYNSVITFDPVYFDEYEPSEMQYYGYVIGKQMTAMTIDTDIEVIEEQFDVIADGEPGFWLAYRPENESVVEEWQEIPRIGEAFDRYHLCFQTTVNPLLEIVFYLENELSCEMLNDLEREAIVFDNEYILRSYVIEQTSDDVIDVLFLWDSSIVFDNSHGYSLQVFRDGEKVGQVDSPVHSVVTHSPITLSTTDAGDYEIRMILYTSETVTSVGGQADDGTIFERDIRIGQVTIDG